MGDEILESEVDGLEDWKSQETLSVKTEKYIDLLCVIIFTQLRWTD